MSRIVPWAALPVVALLGLAAGCGGDDDAEPTAPGTVAVGGVLDAFPITDAPATTAAVAETTDRPMATAPTTTTEPPRTTFAEALADLVDDAPAAPAPTDRVTDDTGRLSLAVPTEWADRSTTSGTLTDGSVTPYVAASPDLREFLDGYDAPGLTVVVLPDPAESADALDSYRFGEDCAAGDAAPYVGGRMAGEYVVWRDCGGTGTDIVTVVAEPDGGVGTVLVLAQIREPGDLVALDTALDSMTVRRR